MYTVSNQVLHFMSKRKRKTKEKKKKDEGEVWDNDMFSHKMLGPFRVPLEVFFNYFVAFEVHLG